MVFTIAICAASSFAHNPDTSYLRCRIESHELELRFTFDPATLHRIVRPDANGDGKITRAEMDAVTPDIFEYLESSVQLEINGVAVTPGGRTGLGWPAEAGDAIAEKDYHTQLLHFTFQCRSQPLIEDVYVCLNVFAELGDRHRTIADIEQEGKHQEVIYTMFEPDYLYDTFWKPGAGEICRRVVAAAWGSPVLWVLLLPPLTVAVFRRSRWIIVPAAVPGLFALSWLLRRELQSVSAWQVWCGTLAASILGAMIFLPVFLCLPRRRKE